MKIADIFSEETSIPVKIWPITEPASGLARIEDGAFDILASLPLDNDIKKNFNVSESIFLDRLVLVQLTDSASGEKAVKSSLDLNGKTVYVAEGSSAVKRMQNLSEEIGGTIKVEQVEDMSDELLCLQVASGTLPLAVVNERIAAAIAKKYPGLSYESTISFTQFQVWVFNKGDTLLYQKFNSWFETFSQSPRYREILNKY